MRIEESNLQPRSTEITGKKKGFKTVYIKKWNENYNSRPSPANQSREMQDSMRNA
jgi:hypothetical protein